LYDALPRTSTKEVARELSNHVAALAAALLGPPTSRQGPTLRWRSRGSLAVTVSGPKRGRFCDYESGEGGDLLDLIRITLGTPLQDALRWAIVWLGGAAVPTAQPRRRAAPARGVKQRQEAARRIWCEAIEPGGSPVEAYLGVRGLALTPDLPLRYHPRCPRGTARLGAMVALVTCPVSGSPIGVHRTYLRPDGSDKAAVTPAKMLLGGAGTIRLAHEVTLGLGIAEGIETALTLLQHAAWSPVWATGSAGGIAAFPVLPGVGALTVFADRDDGGTGLRAAERCAERWRAAGREAVVWQAPVGADFHDAFGGNAR
jgi:putative DNA primase/helicase